MTKLLARLFREEKAATAIEYGLIIALVALAALGAMTGLGGGTTGLWTGIVDQVVQ